MNVYVVSVEREINEYAHEKLLGIFESKTAADTYVKTLPFNYGVYYHVKSHDVMTESRASEIAQFSQLLYRDTQLRQERPPSQRQRPSWIDDAYWADEDWDEPF